MQIADSSLHFSVEPLFKILAGSGWIAVLVHAFGGQKPTIVPFA
jgi:hypothetical protein